MKWSYPFAVWATFLILYDPLEYKRIQKKAITVKPLLSIEAQAGEKQTVQAICMLSLDKANVYYFSSSAGQKLLPKTTENLLCWYNSQSMIRDLCSCRE